MGPEQKSIDFANRVLGEANGDVRTAENDVLTLTEVLRRLDKQVRYNLILQQRVSDLVSEFDVHIKDCNKMGMHDWGVRNEISQQRVLEVGTRLQSVIDTIERLKNKLTDVDEPENTNQYVFTGEQKKDIQEMVDDIDSLHESAFDVTKDIIKLLNGMDRLKLTYSLTLPRFQFFKIAYSIARRRLRQGFVRSLKAAAKQKSKTF